MNKISIEEWKECQIYERKSWGDLVTLDNSFDEAGKQLVYAKYMGLSVNENTIDAENKKILDLGCGPISLLLRTKNFAKAYGVEPLDYGEVVNNIYKEKDINIVKKPIELVEKQDFNCKFDEIWMYNVLQHVIDPSKCLEKMLELGAKKIRIFDWIETPPHEGHPLYIQKYMFMDSLKLQDNEYNIGFINENGAVGKFISIIKDL